ncbi:MAG: DUF2970 domain-containing protein [Proteobacteria bacterium]|nr:DUF2970 domain-containing protein [Pseudomonadota bacterium]MDA1300472.1 DUF2970 domain-containing protein [Pseudomonadota bacterium]
MTDPEQQNTRAAESPNDAPSDRPGTGPGLLDVALSVMAAAIGIQTEANKQRDFSSGNPLAYIIAGLMFTVIFVLLLVGIVNLIL